MTEYKIEKTKDKLIINFYYNYNQLVLPSFISLIILIMLIYAMQFLVFNSTNIVYLVILFLIISYISFNSYFEWKKNKLNEFELLEENLYINRELFLPKYQVKNIFIEYCTNSYESGWTIYLENFLGNKKHIIKKQLTEKDANEIANIISEFLKIKVQKNN
ncbi:hypothetical protein [Flavobacterium sp. 9AF]|uniref:hypothetical protein n=1 Tax=Flavobacterium sp. 9AF TaxID=2653142 RepID=UPI001358B541|nr:hypothetical protein [Flavobacterium sp. 9AF]